MKREKLVVIFLVLTIFFIIIGTSVLGGKNEKVTQPHKDASCGDCHICASPAKEAPCLRECPRFSKTVIVRSPDEGPSIAVLDQLSNLYVPVIFPHKLHAQMTAMGEGCEVCHHHSPAGHFPPCRDCHGGPSNPENLNQPSLKGAYHRQCMNCHREWSHDTECGVCHAKKTAETSGAKTTDATDIMGTLHPNIEEPIKKVYRTKWNKGTVVTFHHKEHIDLFGLKCVDCHQEENCSRCHDIQMKTNAVKSIEEHHKPCASCHLMDGCGHCHTKKEMPGFTHTVTGWPLNLYHQNLNCHACHVSGRMMEKLNPDCNSCHSDWTAETFHHAVTGLALDETHKQMECVNCHLEHKFDQKSSCANCHEDSRAYPESMPGTFNQKTKKG